MRVRKETGANWSEYIYFGSEVLTELATAPGLTSSALSQSGLSAFNPSVIVDGGTVCCGWHTDTATAGAFLRADLGAPAAVASVRIYASTPGYAGNYSIQRSDDNSNWTTVATFAPNAAGWNTVKWVQVTAHRYWRLHLNNTPGSGSWLNELQFGVWTDYIFAGGKRVAKAPGVAATSGTQYYHSDHLGSARLMTDASGNPVAGSEGTFLPFGQEYAPTTAGNHYKFTGKERDSESGLDYFGARYYGSTMGRFMTIDPKPTSARLTNPQTWNRYTYALNNPQMFVDPDGRDIVLASNLSKQDREYVVQHLARLYSTPAGKAMIERVDQSKFTVEVGMGKLGRTDLTKRTPGTVVFGGETTKVDAGQTSYNSAKTDGHTVLVAQSPDSPTASPIQVTIDKSQTAEIGKDPAKVMAHELGGHTADVINAAESNPAHFIDGVDPNSEDSSKAAEKAIGKLPGKPSEESVKAVEALLQKKESPK